MRLNKKYILPTLLLLGIEIIIAVWVTQVFIRGFLGDVLVVLLLFSFLKMFLKYSSETIALSVLLFAFSIEGLQLLNPVERLQINSEAIKIIIGSTFDVWDLAAYALGYLIIIFKKQFRRKSAKEFLNFF